MSKNVLEIIRDGMNALLEKNKKVELETEEKTVELAQMKLENGTIIEAEEFSANQPVVIVSEDGNVPLPVGDYVLEDGNILVVAEEGMIAEIKEAEAEQEEMNGEFVTVAQFNQVIEEIKGMFTNMGKDPTRTTTTKVVESLKKEVADLSEEKTELQKQLDEKPDAALITHAPVELKEVPAKNAQERIMQKIRNLKN